MNEITHQNPAESASPARLKTSIASSTAMMPAHEKGGNGGSPEPKRDDFDKAIKWISKAVISLVLFWWTIGDLYIISFPTHQQTAGHSTTKVV